MINLTPEGLRQRKAVLGFMLFDEDIDDSEESLADPDKYYQVQLLYEAGYIKEDAYSASRRGPFSTEFSIERLTNEGHDFLDSIRDDSVFAKVKDGLGVVGGTASLAVVKALADSLIKSGLGL